MLEPAEDLLIPDIQKSKAPRRRPYLFFQNYEVFYKKLEPFATWNHTNCVSHDQWVYTWKGWGLWDESCGCGSSRQLRPPLRSAGG